MNKTKKKNNNFTNSIDKQTNKIQYQYKENKLNIKNLLFES